MQPMGNSAPTVHVTELPDAGDARGQSYSLGALLTARIGKVEDAHLATIIPGAVRGNHYHVSRREAILVLFQDGWTLHHDNGEGTEPRRRAFTGAGAALIDVDRLCAHAIENTGARDLVLIGCSNGPWDEANPDSYRRIVVR
jgi:dTDP-4-dehydrorhamnose 3,5-epimerase-like enzyme